MPSRSLPPALAAARVVRSEPLVDVPVPPDARESFGRVLERVLERHTAGPREAPGRLLAGLTEEDLPASAPLVGEDERVHVGDLERAGIGLTVAQRAQATLQNDMLSVGSLGLGRVQRFPSRHGDQARHP